MGLLGAHLRLRSVASQRTVATRVVGVVGPRGEGARCIAGKPPLPYGYYSYYSYHKRRRPSKRIQGNRPKTTCPAHITGKVHTTSHCKYSRVRVLRLATLCGAGEENRLRMDFRRDSGFSKLGSRVLWPFPISPAPKSQSTFGSTLLSLRLWLTSPPTSDIPHRLSLPRAQTGHLGSGGLPKTCDTSVLGSLRTSLTQRQTIFCSLSARVDGLRPREGSRFQVGMAPDKS